MSRLDSPTIGPVGHRNDPDLSELARAIEARGAKATTLDLTDIPAHVNFHWERDSLRLGELDLLSLAALYVRTGVFPMPLQVPGKSREESEALTFPIRELGSLLSAIIGELARHVAMVNPPDTYQYHRQKPFMYSTLARAGVPVPEFAVGSDLEQAALFVDRHAEQTVAKPLMGGEVVLADFGYLEQHHAELDRRPLLLQRRILGRSVRGYVVGGRLIASAEVVHGDVVDWRSDVRAIRPVRLSEAAEAAVVRVSTALGLVFAAVDVEEEGGADGPPWVLDVNPAPLFAGFSARSALDVAGPLADYLLGLARTRASHGDSSEGEA